MKKLLVTLAILLGVSGVAHAGIMFEPYLGYESGKFTNPNGKSDGVNLGARLAYKLPVMLWFGLDANIGVSGKMKPDSGSDADMKRNTFYGVVGVDLPILLRAWAGYGFSDQFVLDTPYNSTIKGKSFKLGVGFTGLPFVSLNVEYLKSTADEITGGTLANSSPDSKHEAVMVSVSLPFVF